MSRRDEILAFIIKDTAKNGYAPTIREISKAVGLKSSSTAHGHIQRLIRDGLLQMKTDSPRSITVVGEVSDSVKVIKTRNGVNTVIEWQGKRYVFDPVVR